MKYSFILVSIIFLSGFVWLVNEYRQSNFNGDILLEVVEVIDGDTITLSDKRRVRLIGIDAPEMGKECFALESKKILEGMIANQNIKLQKDKDLLDKYGRSLYYLWIGETFINKEMVIVGAAKSVTYPPNTKHQIILDEAENTARENKLGLWGC